MSNAIIKVALIGIVVFIAGEYVEACSLGEYDVTRALIAQGDAARTACENELPRSQLLSALRVIATYWDSDSTNSQRYGLLSKRYRDALVSSRKITNPNQYSIPGAESERVWRGYRINDIDVVSDKSIEVSLQVRWEQEGFHGTITYLMVLVSDASQWSIANIHF